MKIWSFLGSFLFAVGLIAECDLCNPSDFQVAHLEGSGIGFNRGYTSAEALLASSSKDCFVPFLDLRAHVFNNGKFASNLGVGARYGVGQWTLGGNIYWDYREDGVLYANQLGLGFEALWKHFDFRLNGYVATGEKKSGGQRTFSRFEGHHALLHSQTHGALSHIGASFGVPWNPSKNTQFYLELVPYYLFDRTVAFRRCGGVFGGQGALKAEFFDCLRLSCTGSYDATYRWRVNGAVSLNFKLFNKGNKKRHCRLGHGIMRDEIIPFVKKNDYLTDGSGDRVRFVFVDNVNGSSDGSFEHPFLSLSSAETHSRVNDIIYLFPGDGTSRNYDQGFTMKQGQTLQGAGFDITVGDVTVPAMVPGQYAKVDNPSGIGITTAVDNTIRGIEIETVDIGATGISAENSNKLILDSMRVVTPSTYGVSVSGTGTGVVSLDCTSSMIHSIELTALNDSVMTVNLRDSDFIEMGLYGISLVSHDQAVMNATVSNAEISGDNTQDGIIVHSNNGSTLAASLKNVRITGSNTVNGILAFSDEESNMTFDMTDVSITRNNSQHGIRIFASDTSTYSSTINNLNILSDQGFRLFLADSRDAGSNMSIKMENSTISGDATFSATSVFVRDQSVANLVFNNNTFATTLTHALEVFPLFATSNTCVTLDGNTATGGDFYLRNTAGSTFNITDLATYQSNNTGSFDTPGSFTNTDSPCIP